MLGCSVHLIFVYKFHFLYIQPKFRLFKMSFLAIHTSWCQPPVQSVSSSFSVLNELSSPPAGRTATLQKWQMIPGDKFFTLCTFPITQYIEETSNSH